MLLKQFLNYLDTLNKPENLEPDTLRKWHSYHDANSFLTMIRDGDVPIHLSSSRLFVFSYILPIELLKDEYTTELLQWDVASDGGYGYGSTYDGKNSTDCLFEPMDNVKPELLRDSTPVFFERYFSGFKPTRYLELNQKFSHVLDLHWVKDKSASLCAIMKATTSQSKFSIELKGEEQENQDGQQAKSTSAAEARTSPFQCRVQTPYCA